MNFRLNIRNRNFFKGKTSVKKIIISFMIVAIIELLAFYAILPPLNLHSMTFWKFQGFFLFVFFLLTFSIPNRTEPTVKYNIISKIAGITLLLGVLIVIIGNITSAKIFNASRYASLIKINETDFQNAILESESIGDIALMDTASARVVGQRAIGSLSDVVSQYVISDSYNQIALNDEPMKVSSLEYAGFFKWFNNKSSGIPGYVLVDAVNFETEYVKLEKPIKYTTSGWFNDNLERHVRFQYPTKIFEGYYFEIDEEGNPFYICPTMTAKVGLFGGYDIEGVVICDPCSGDSKYYELGEIPSWVDRVYDGDLIAQKYNWYGSLSDGFWNSIIGQKDCKMTTDDYGYKVINNDVWIYTGITSVTDDSSNIGFVLVNSRTCETKYFKVAGAEEFSAMGAAEGQVQNLGYKAAFPSLINIDGRPAYLMVLKDKENLVKQYAIVDVKKYSIVATGTTQKDTLSTYRSLLKQNGIEGDPDQDTNAVFDSEEITVKNIKYINVDGETVVYITSEKGEVYKEVFSKDETLIFIQENDKITIYYDIDEGTNIKIIKSWNPFQEEQQETVEETTQNKQ